MSTYLDAADQMLVRRVHLFADTQGSDIAVSAEAVIFTDPDAQQRARFWFKGTELEHFRRLMLGDAPVAVRTAERTDERWESSLAYRAHERALRGLALLEDGGEADYLTVRAIAFELGRLRARLVRTFATFHRCDVVRDGDRIVFTSASATRAAAKLIGEDEMEAFGREVAVSLERGTWTSPLDPALVTWEEIQAYRAAIDAYLELDARRRAA